MFKLYENNVYTDKTVKNKILGQINCIAYALVISNVIKKENITYSIR